MIFGDVMSYNSLTTIQILLKQESRKISFVKKIADEEDDYMERQELLKNRHPKYFFENSEKQILSVYKCIFANQSEKSNISDSESLSYISKISSPKFSFKWAILMLGGGHFAGAVFDGSKAVVHKTFHCYTVRAKQGGSQSMADNRSGTNHPKSAGASLRRYNQVRYSITVTAE